MGKSALPIHTTETGATKDPFGNAARMSQKGWILGHQEAYRRERKHNPGPEGSLAFGRRLN